MTQEIERVPYGEKRQVEEKNEPKIGRRRHKFGRITDWKARPI